ncbi:YfiT family bacillithiol transferase [Deinococcus sp. PESE-13]
MIDPRYPLGPMPEPRDLSDEERQEARAALRALPAELRAAVAGLSEPQLDTPYREGGWTVRQVVHHVADRHLNAYVHTARVLSGGEALAQPEHEEAWAALPASSFATELSLLLLERLHIHWDEVLADVTDWQQAGLRPDGGEWTLDGLLGQAAWHGRHHTAHITRLREREGW